MSTPGIFHLRGNTRRLMAQAGLSSGAVQMSTIAGMPQASDYTLTNFGPSVAFVGWGPDADTAIDNAREPTTATPRFCVVLYPGQRSIEARHGAFFAASTASGSADILVSPGHGLVDGFGAGNIAGDLSDSAALLALLSHGRGEQNELLRGTLIELRVITNFLKQGLNVAEDPDAARSDEAPRIN